MPSRSVVLPAAFLISALVLAAPAAADYPWPKPESFDVLLAPVGDSGVTGTAHLVLRGERLSLILRAYGLDPGEVHPVIVHGFPGRRSSICPDLSPAVQERGTPGPDDVPWGFGQALLGLDPSPEADLGGVIAFEHAYDVDPATIAPLSRRTLVLYHESGTPVACGEIRAYPAT